jgi:hypothetical protein
VDTTQKVRFVGTVDNMPGTTGFTMAAFKAEEVPLGTRLYMFPKVTGDASLDVDPDVSDPCVLWAEIHRLSEELKGPEGYETWKDAAIAERLRATKAEAKARGCAFLIERGALQTAINMLRRDAEEGFKVRGEIAEELARSIIPNGN